MFPFAMLSLRLWLCLFFSCWGSFRPTAIGLSGQFGPHPCWLQWWYPTSQAWTMFLTCLYDISAPGIVDSTFPLKEESSLLCSTVPCVNIRMLSVTIFVSKEHRSVVLFFVFTCYRLCSKLLERLALSWSFHFHLSFSGQCCYMLVLYRKDCLAVGPLCRVYFLLGCTVEPHYLNTLIIQANELGPYTNEWVGELPLIGTRVMGKCWIDSREASRPSAQKNIGVYFSKCRR